METDEVTVSTVCKALEDRAFNLLQTGTTLSRWGKSARSCPRQGTLALEIKRLFIQYPVFGYRRIWALLQRKGYPYNRKTVYRG
ncbi:IS3 family transposase [Kroppenstedtia guangzhouensis]|uniref:IS3 family transposase n=1 Tax=Kroppenstedtia guangzhouensis TaxID=1274356 RepID=UPI003570ABD9